MMHSNEKYYHAKYDQLMIMAPPQNFTAPPLATPSGTSQNRHWAADPVRVVHVEPIEPDDGRLAS